jgi:hypothetical protein
VRTLGRPAGARWVGASSWSTTEYLIAVEDPPLVLDQLAVDEGSIGPAVVDQDQLTVLGQDRCVVSGNALLEQ